MKTTLKLNTILQSSLLIALVCLSGCATGTGGSHYAGRANTLPTQRSEPAPACDVVIKFRAKYDPEQVDVLSSTKKMGRGREDRVLADFCNEACRLGADLVSIQEEKQRATYYFAKVEYIKFHDRSVVRRLRSDISYDPQFISQRVQEAKQRNSDQNAVIMGAAIGGAFGGAIGGAIGAAAAGR